MSLERLLNLAIDFALNRPKRISFSIPTNSVQMHIIRFPQISRYNGHTLVFLSKYLCEVECPLDRRVPGLGLECEFHLGPNLIYRRKLKEVASNDELYI